MSGHKVSRGKREEERKKRGLEEDDAGRLNDPL